MPPPAQAGLTLRHLAQTYLAAVALFAVLAASLALRDHLTDLFVDDWRVLDRYQTRGILAYLFTAENGHYLPVTLALFALDHELLDGRMHGLTLASLVCLALAAGWLWRAFREHDGLAASMRSWSV